jgi:type III secretion protein J
MPSTFSLRRLALALPFAAALLAACSNQELYSQLSERQANEMVAVLRSAGIDAEKQAKDGQFAVLTAASDFPQAVRTLSAQGYPRETFDSMGKVFKREGFVSSPLEERARLVFAMSQEIANTLTSIDGVVTARVHLVVPERNPLADRAQPSAASVFIKHRPDKDLSSQIAQIKALVVNSIEGLSYDNVTVALFPAESLPAQPAVKAAPTAAATATAERSAALPVPLVAGSLAGAMAFGGGGLMWWRRRSTPRRAPASANNLLPNELQAALNRASARRGKEAVRS